MLLIRSQIYNLLMYLLILVVGLWYAPAALRSVEGAYRGIARFGKINRWLLKTICGITYEVRGKIPDEQCLVLAKHMSFLDIIILGTSLPAPKFIMKAELKWVPILGFYANRIGSAPVYRGKAGATEKMLQDVENNAHRNADGQLVIYPQGTRVLPGQKLPYKRGAAKIYQNFDLPAHMVATNVGVLWKRRSAYRYPGLAIIEFLEPRIEPGMDTNAFMALISERIETRSDELMAAYPAYYKAEEKTIDDQA